MQINITALKRDHAISRTMYGVFIEDINYGCDGGLYAELVANRAFEQVNHAGEDCRMMRWSPVGGSAMSIGTQDPRGDKNPHYLRLKGAKGRPFGVRNEGYLGEGFHAAQGESYHLTLIARAAENAVIHAVLTSVHGDALAEQTITVGPVWQKQRVEIPMGAPSQRAYLTLWVEGAQWADFDFVSLFPADTFMGRENGLRKDIAQTIADLHPAFLRFPGGCIVEGRSFESMYRFKETLGPLEERRTNWNRWQMDEYQKEGRTSADYFQTYGMGFYEFFQFCEDIGARPLPILNCGMTCQWHESLTVPLDEMDAYIQDYFDLIEFANGAADTPMGKIRAEMGHPAPFHLEMIGVGNEQWEQTYFERYEMIHAAVKAKHPEIHLVGCAGWTDHGEAFDHAMTWMKQTPTRPDYSDEHFYKPTQWFFDHDHRYDTYDPALPRVFMGEYAAHADLKAGKKHNSLHTALAEAAFLTGVENTPDAVSMTCYAPLLARVGGFQWYPDMIWFDEKSVYRTPNYHVQQMYAQHRGDYLAEYTHQDDAGLYTTASWREDGTIILKVVNPGDASVAGSITFPGDRAQVRSTVLTGKLEDVNTLSEPDKVHPVTGACSAANGAFDWDFQPRSVTMLMIQPE